VLQCVVTLSRIVIDRINNIGFTVVFAEQDKSVLSVRITRFFAVKKHPLLEKWMLVIYID
jgi:hypothetical protein